VPACGTAAVGMLPPQPDQSVPRAGAGMDHSHPQVPYPSPLYPICATCHARPAPPAPTDPLKDLFAGGTFVNRTLLESALTLRAWHHVALHINTTSCALFVDAALVGAAVRCDVSSMVDFGAPATITVGVQYVFTLSAFHPSVRSVAGPSA
jgi:hypothetical protein